ncbi:tetratricopeptide repeat protein [Tepidamorphus sp. 3E244]|uniref:tetratricopeptide repeat protein n=1 Tax=Tepidamorphus sp. 3E244 TaxID=3385498 RepID=UPI0038FCBDC0
MTALHARSSSILAGLALGAAIAFGATAAMAMGSDTTTETNCPSGQIKDSDGKCKPSESNAIDNEARIIYGLSLAKAERYDEALAVLATAADQNDPRVLNYTGYSLRKSGKVEEGIGYYKQALAADPNYVQAREYLGEAYLTLGRLDLAEEQLAEIEKRCVADCDTYLDLSDQIEDFRERQQRG